MGDEIACPAGTIDLIADMWDCKLTGRRCPIQACLHRHDWSAFEKHCEAPAERREGIKATVLSGAYDGFHHTAGKWLCPLCKPARSGRRDQMYHYREELFELSAFVDCDETTLRRWLMINDVPVTAQTAPLCRKCLDDALQNLGLDRADV